MYTVHWQITVVVNANNCAYHFVHVLVILHALQSRVILHRLTILYTIIYIQLNIPAGCRQLERVHKQHGVHYNRCCEIKASSDEHNLK